MNSNNKKKHYKWTSDWEAEIKIIAEKEEDKLFKKGETKPDGNKVEKDEGETIKIKVVENLFKQIAEKKKLAKDKLKAFNDKTGEGEELVRVYQEYEDLDKKMNDTTDGWIASVANKTAYINRYKDFQGNGTGTKYGTGNVGMKALQKEYIERKFKDVAGVDNQDYSNLYEFSTRTEKDINKITSWKLTEQEVIKLLTRIIHEVKKIKKVKWDDFVDTELTIPTPAPSVRNRVGNRWDGTVNYGKNDLKTWLDNIRTIALVDNEIKDSAGNGTGKYTNGKRLEYSFAQDYTEYETTTPLGTQITANQLQSLFNFLEALKRDYSNWEQGTKFKGAITDAGFEDETNLTVLPAQAEPVAEQKLKDWGITGYTIDPTTKKTNYYLTDYGTQLSSTKDDPTVKSEFSWDTKKEIKVENGLKGWLQLGQDVLLSGGGGNYWYQERKLMSSLITDPLSQLFQDTRTTDEFGRFGTANAYTLNDFPTFLAFREKRLKELKIKKKRLLTSSKDQEEIDKLDQEYQTARTELTTAKAELEKKITERVDEIRASLKTKFSKHGLGVGETYKGFKKTGNDDYRLENLTDISSIIYQIKMIKYLETADEEGQSSNANENTAFTELDALQNKLFRTVNPTTEADKKLERTMNFMLHGSTHDVNKRIEEVKEHVEGSWQLYTWQDLIDGFDEIEKLIKLPANYIAAKEAIKKHMTKPDEPEEKLTDWQSKIKAIDPLITETVFTEEKMKDFQKHNGFKKVDGILSLIKKVCDKEGTDDAPTFKVKKAFIDDYLVKEEAEVKDLGAMITKWDAEKIIKLISFFDYEKNQKDEEKKKIRRAYSWEKSKKVNDKFVETDGDYPEANITDDEKKLDGEFTKFLMSLTTGDKSLNSISKPTEQNNPPTPNENGDNKEMSFAKEWFGFGSVPKSLLMYFGIILVIGLVTGAMFWKSIKEWWDPSDLKEGAEDEDKEDSEE